MPANTLARQLARALYGHPGCGRFDTVPGDCPHDHLCCLLWADLTPDRPCSACAASRTMHRRHGCCDGLWTGSGPAHGAGA